MSKKQMTPIFYYIPEDKDDQDTLNLFTINIRKEQIKLKHIYQNFPLKGTYIFRFKIMYDNIIGWLDLPNMEAKLPFFKQKIIIKALRVSWKEQFNNNKTQTTQNKKNSINLMEDHLNLSSSSQKHNKHGDLI